ncbi:MAG: hypothetical protein LBT53_05000 [Puniceicoccales bacterium]|nr:hypothetical protein [Puniceicoccales bacterium]
MENKISLSADVIASKAALLSGFMKKHYLSSLDSGDFIRKPFKIIYRIVAVLNLLFPFYVLFNGISNGILKAPFNIVLAVVLFWVTIVLASWVSAVLWWDRSSKVEQITSAQSDFVATPAFSHLLQTLGEWVGSYIAIVGSFGSLFLLLFGGQELAARLGVSGFAHIILSVVVGFLTILVTRFLAESISAVSAIANNTKNIPVPEIKEPR